MSPLLRSGKMSEITGEVNDEHRGLALITGFGEKEGIYSDSIDAWWTNSGILDVLRPPRTIVARIEKKIIVLVPHPGKG